jgi:EEF1A lysine methyltransferase 4
MTGGGPAAASQAYGEAWYWDERYRKEAGPFDWYQKYPALAPLLRLYLAPHQRLLLVGCGNSGESLFLSAGQRG